ncbi:hypothetical protein FB45DRAFT_740283 [Roridomyces roridus]|uniref:Integral membrane protein n=1 Tax=Roridomyces roridus TaxID=1738132 RepID=A0AAD7C4X0_9AGAR|nr:hypothetical protein FB45DRAFT_740283 [Roridomyces roridus]
MPSVRVRRGSTFSSSAYSSHRPLTEIFPPTPAVASPEPPSLLVSNPTSSPRSSRIHSHILRNRASSVGFRSLSPDSLEVRPGSPHSRHSRHSAVQAEISVRPREDGEPGLIGSALSVSSLSEYSEPDLDLDHHDDIVEHLDVIDPQVGTVSTLTNAANAIYCGPPMSWYSRKPVVTLSSHSVEDLNDPEQAGGRDDLDRHVEDVLNNRSKIRRTLKGVWTFLKTPQIIVGIYGFAVVFWGAAIVFFLAKFINFHNANTQGFWVEVSSQVENGLFTVAGIGLIPSRVLDTYRIYWIWHFKRRTRMLRAKAGLPELFDVDDLPDPVYDPNYVHVLTDEEQKKLHRQQVKFQRHQTWYRAHGTETHRAFPINTALLICLLNDGNSIFQIMLCGTMWGLDRFQRPAWTTGILIPASFLCGIFSAGVYRTWGEQDEEEGGGGGEVEGCPCDGCYGTCAASEGPHGKVGQRGSGEEDKGGGGGDCVG